MKDKCYIQVLVWAWGRGHRFNLTAKTSVLKFFPVKRSVQMFTHFLSPSSSRRTSISPWLWNSRTSKHPSLSSRHPLPQSGEQRLTATEDKTIHLTTCWPLRAVTASCSLTFALFALGGKGLNPNGHVTREQKDVAGWSLAARLCPPSLCKTPRHRLYKPQPWALPVHVDHVIFCVWST